MKTSVKNCFRRITALAAALGLLFCPISAKAEETRQPVGIVNGCSVYVTNNFSETKASVTAEVVGDKANDIESKILLLQRNEDGKFILVEKMGTSSALESDTDGSTQTHIFTHQETPEPGYEIVGIHCVTTVNIDTGGTFTFTPYWGQWYFGSEMEALLNYEPAAEDAQSFLPEISPETAAQLKKTVKNISSLLDTIYQYLDSIE